MSGQLSRLNVSSKEYTGNTTFPANTGRGYFFVVMTDGTGTISFGDGTGEIPLAAGAYFEPYVVPTSKITITTTGTFVVLTDKQV